MDHKYVIPKKPMFSKGRQPKLVSHLICETCGLEKFEWFGYGETSFHFWRNMRKFDTEQQCVDWKEEDLKTCD